MQCEFSKEELEQLDQAMMRMGIDCKLTLQNGNPELFDKEKLEANIKRIDALHYKLLGLLGTTREKLREFI